MPTYSYKCCKCHKGFELFFHIKDYNDKPKCIFCKNLAERDYIVDISTLASSVKKSDSELKTIGDLANRNRDRLSEDQKLALYNKHNDYKNEEPTKALPKGMSRMKKPKTKIKWTK